MNMRTPIHVSLIAGLTLAGIGSAAADSDISVWRWHVANVLRAQQQNDPPPLLSEGRASAIDQNSSFVQRNERYFADGSLAPAGDSAHR
jgi:hypothetical protein